MIEISKLRRIAVVGLLVLTVAGCTSSYDVPLGASGHPGSPHYADQTGDWAAVRLRPMRYDWGRVAAEAESHQRLEPAPSR